MYLFVEMMSFVPNTLTFVYLLTYFFIQTSDGVTPWASTDLQKTFLGRDK